MTGIFMTTVSLGLYQTYQHFRSCTNCELPNVHLGLSPPYTPVPLAASTLVYKLVKILENQWIFLNVDLRKFILFVHMNFKNWFIIWHLSMCGSCPRTIRSSCAQVAHCCIGIILSSSLMFPYLETCSSILLIISLNLLG